MRGERGPTAPSVPERGTGPGSAVRQYGSTAARRSDRHKSATPEARGQTPHPAPGAVAFERWDCRHRPELIPGPPGPPGQVSPCATSCCCSKHPAGSCLLVLSAARQCERLRLETTDGTVAPAALPKRRTTAVGATCCMKLVTNKADAAPVAPPMSGHGRRPVHVTGIAFVCRHRWETTVLHAGQRQRSARSSRLVSCFGPSVAPVSPLAGQCANRAQQQARDIGHEREAGGWRGWSGMLPTPASLSCALHAAAGPALSRLPNLAGLPRSPRRPSPVSHDRRTEGRTWRYLAGWKLCFWTLAASGNNDVPITYQARASSCKLWPDQRRVLAIHYSAAWRLPKRAILAFSIKSIHNTHLLPLQRKAEAVNEPRPPGFECSSRIGPFCRLRTHLPSSASVATRGQSA